MGPRRIALSMLLAAGSACAQPAPMEATKRIFQPPAIRWDHAMFGYRPAVQQTPADLSNATGGFAFGMSPVSVNRGLPQPLPDISWAGLAIASEYPGDVRFFSIPVSAAGPLRMDLTGCVGAGSNLVFLFDVKGLVRISYRLSADKNCADPGQAAQQIFARYVPVGLQVALSTRYRTGRTEVVDITDPGAGYLVPVRFRQGG